MEIVKAEFIISAVRPEQYPKDNLPCIALVGRSNVGKSSLINNVTNRSKLARTSGKPGKTRLINFYRVNDTFYLVDLPGYGYAKVSKKEKENWAYMIETFLNSSSDLRGIVQLVDIRHSPTQDDITMANWVRHFGKDVIIVATKADKLGKTRRKPQLDRIRRSLDVPNDVALIPFSSQTGYGKDRFLSSLDNMLEKFKDHQCLQD